MGWISNRDKHSKFEADSRGKILIIAFMSIGSIILPANISGYKRIVNIFIVIWSYIKILFKIDGNKYKEYIRWWCEYIFK